MPDGGVGGSHRPPFTLAPEELAVEETGSVKTELGFHLSLTFPAEVRQWEELIVEAAQESGLDPNLYAALIKKESWTFDRELCPDGPVTPSCTSRSGALGIAQVMPFHFSEDEEGRDPRTNIFRGAEILSEYLARKNGDVRMGLAAYNCGPNRSTYDSGCWAYADQILEWYREVIAP